MVRIIKINEIGLGRLLNFRSEFNLRIDIISWMKDDLVVEIPIKIIPIDIRYHSYEEMEMYIY